MNLRRLIVAAAAGLCALAAPGTGVSSAGVVADFHTLRTLPLAPGQFEIITLSTLPDTVTGGDVTVAIRGLAPDDAYSVAVNDVDATASFTRVSYAEARGLVSGLVEGENTISATVDGAAGERTASLSVRNHPRSGPVISGPHQVPFRCETERSGLGAPIDENCSAPTRMQWFYKSTEDLAYHELADPYAPYPDDVATTKTSDGRVVPSVVRVESATINRGIARIAVLDDPRARGAEAPFRSNWNRRVTWVFGEACGPGYRQGSSQPSYVLGDLPFEESGDRIVIAFAGVQDRLQKGDAVVHSTLTSLGVHCNGLISAETMMMVKEHISERYGEISEVVGAGASGGAIQQYNLANNYPGLLTGALPLVSFPDVVSTTMTVGDCGLLARYYGRSDIDWTDAKRAAVDGHPNVPYEYSICQSWVNSFLSLLDPTDRCVPANLMYDPEENPAGVRCSLQDANVNVWGRDPQTGFARRPLDNTGVQYGLRALRDGAITFEEFLDLNANVGGYDIDMNWVPQRMRMDAEAESIAYRSGQVIGRGALDETPVIDLGTYVDLIPYSSLNIHEAVRPFTTRARMRERGAGPSQSIWRGVVTQGDAYPAMDRWLAAIRGSSETDRSVAVAASKPSDAGDRCVIGTLGGRVEGADAAILPFGAQAPLVPDERIPTVGLPLHLNVPEDHDSGIGPCSIALPVTRTPRMVAGMPMSDDIIKCRLKPVDPADYGVPLSAEQLARLQAVFPDGVCDWTRPAAGDVQRSIIWPSFGGTTLLTDAAGDPAPVGLQWRVARSG